MVIRKLERRVFFLPLMILCNCFSAYTQSRKVISIPPGVPVIQNIPFEDKYFYPSFTEGKCTYTNGRTVTLLMNYNVLFDRMQYLNSRKDTFDLDRDISLIVIGSDSFYHDKFYYRVLKDYDKIRLVRREMFAYVQRRKEPADTSVYYNTYEIIGNPLYLKGISAKDTFRLARTELYYFADVKGKTWNLHRDYLIQFYPYREKAFLEYMKGKRVSLSDLKAIEAMLDFLTAKTK